jgi:enediyne biosynthesis protein E4
VSQPFDRKARIPRPGELDKSLKEWWVENPWDIPAEGKNLSCYERKRIYMNTNGGNFLEVSHLTGGADSDGDGRSIVAGDFSNNGRLELALRQVGGDSFLLFENHFPQRHYLEVTLRGKPTPGKIPTSNRQGIGARLIAEVNGRQIVRELFPANSFSSQTSLVVHFGLADDSKVDRLVIRWPSGTEQVLVNVPGDQHIVVEEGSLEFERVVPGQTNRP